MLLERAAPFGEKNRVIASLHFFLWTARFGVPLQFVFSPMLLFAIGIEDPFNVPVQCPHDTDARHHGRAVEFDDQEQGSDRSLPLLEILLILRKLHDVVGGIAQSHELAPTR